MPTSRALAERTAMKRLNAAYDESPELYDAMRDCWLNERRLAFIVGEIARRRPSAGARVLEIGSGTGWLLRRLAERFPELSFVGLEPIEGYVSYARSRGLRSNVSLALGRAEEAHEAVTGTVDVILSCDVLHHVESSSTTVASLSRIAPLGTTWIAIEPNWKNPYVFFGSANKPGERNFWPRAFERDARRAGWSRRARGHLFLIPPFWKRPPAWMKAIESRLEWIPWIAGGVYLELERVDLAPN
jgi:SAM-dependent methyltransferase